jgi:hypothetical protein
MKLQAGSQRVLVHGDVICFGSGILVSFFTRLCCFSLYLIFVSSCFFLLSALPRILKWFTDLKSESTQHLANPKVLLLLTADGLLFASPLLLFSLFVPHSLATKFLEEYNKSNSSSSSPSSSSSSSSSSSAHSDVTMDTQVHTEIPTPSKRPGPLNRNDSKTIPYGRHPGFLFVCFFCN